MSSKESGSNVKLNVGVATVESLTHLLTLARSGLALHLSAHAVCSEKAGTKKCAEPGHHPTVPSGCGSRVSIASSRLLASSFLLLLGDSSSDALAIRVLEVSGS